MPEVVKVTKDERKIHPLVCQKIQGEWNEEKKVCEINVEHLSNGQKRFAKPNGHKKGKR